MDDNTFVVMSEPETDSPASEPEAESVDSAASGTDVSSATDLASGTDIPLEPSEISGSVTVENLFDRPIMTTPLNDYTVTEGLLLLIFLVLGIRTIFKIFNN